MKKLIALLLSYNSIPLRLFVTLLFLRACIDSIANISEVMFVQRVGVNHLPILYIIEDISIIFILFAFGKISRHFENYKIIWTLSTIFIAGIIVFFYMTTLYEGVYYLFYLWQSLFLSLISIVFWLFCNEFFHIQDSKTVFPIIMVGGITGTIAGNFTAALLSQFFASTTSIILSLLFLIASLSTLRSIDRKNIDEIVLPQTDSHQQLWGWKRVLHLPFVIAFLALVIFWGILHPIIRFELYAIAKESLVSERDLITFLGIAKATVVLLIIPFQLMFVGKIIRHLGIPHSLCILPIFVFCSLTALAFLPNLFAVVIIFAIFAILKNGLEKSVQKSFINIFHQQRKKISVLIKQSSFIGKLTGAGLLLLLSTVSLWQINAILAVATAFFLLLSLRLPHWYQEMCRKLFQSPVDLVVSLRKESQSEVSQKSKLWHKLLEQYSHKPEPSGMIYLRGYKTVNSMRIGIESSQRVIDALAHSSYMFYTCEKNCVFADIESQPFCARQLLQQTIDNNFASMLSVYSWFKEQPSWLTRWLQQRHLSWGETIFSLLKIVYPGLKDDLQTMIRLWRSSHEAYSIEILQSLPVDDKKTIGTLLQKDAKKAIAYANRHLKIRIPPSHEDLWQQLCSIPDTFLRYQLYLDAKDRNCLPQQACLQSYYLPANEVKGVQLLVNDMVIPEKSEAMREYVHSLQKMKSTFSKLSMEELLIIARCIQEKDYDSGETIFCSGQKLNFLYILVAGEISLVLPSSKQRMLISEQGYVLGETSLCSHTSLWSAKAQTPTKIYIIDYNSVDELMNYYPKFSNMLIHTIANKTRDFFERWKEINHD